MEVGPLDEPRVLEAFEAAAEIGIPVLNIGPSGKSDDPDDLTECVNRMEALSERAEQAGVTLCVKALWGCTPLFCIPGLFLTFVAPSAVIELTRVGEEHVDVTVVRKVLFVVPISERRIEGLLAPKSQVIFLIASGSIVTGKPPAGKGTSP